MYKKQIRAIFPDPHQATEYVLDVCEELGDTRGIELSRHENKVTFKRKYWDGRLPPYRSTSCKSRLNLCAASHGTLSYDPQRETITYTLSFTDLKRYCLYGNIGFGVVASSLNPESMIGTVVLLSIFFWLFVFGVNRLLSIKTLNSFVDQVIRETKKQIHAARFE